MKRVFKFISIFLLLIMIFNLLLLSCSLFSSDLIEENVRESSKILMSEGNVYQFFTYYSAANNNYTDSLIINEAYSIDSSNPVYSYMSVRKNYKAGQTQTFFKDNPGESISINNTEQYDPVGELNEFLNGTIDTSITYARYWHGYLPLIRTLLIFFNISQIRIVLLIVFIALFAYLIYLLYKKLGIKVAIVYILALILEDYFFVSYSLESAPVFIVMMLACIILLKKLDKIKDWYMFVFIIACITNFVDYLTVPLITLAMPLYIYILYNQKHNDKFTYKYCLILVIKSSIIWTLGYALTWLSKWVLYDLLYNEGLIKSAINQVLHRSSRNSHIWQLILIMLSNRLIYLILILQLLILLIFFYQIYKINHKENLNYYFNRKHTKNCLPFLLISLMPFVWYVALANHTIIHYFFVYRHLLVFFTGLFLCINNILIVQKQNISLKCSPDN